MRLPLTISFVLVLLSLISGASLALEPPSDVPVYYYGWVLVNGKLAPDGTTVTAESDGSRIGSATVPSTISSGSGYYHIYVNSSYSGRATIFKVNGVTAATLTLPERGSAALLNLSVTTTSGQNATGAGGSSGVSGTGQDGTGSQGLEISETQSIGFIQGGEKKVINFTKDVVLRSLTIPAKEVISGGTVTVKREAGRPSGIPAPEGIPYAFLNMTSTAQGVENLTFTFAVGKVWVSDNSINESMVRLLRYADSWQTLPTILLAEEKDAFVYEATSPSLSIFAIIGVEKEKLCQGEGNECFGQRLERCEDGLWVLVEVCQHGCDPVKKACLPPPAICMEGEKRCSGSVAETCEYGSWKASPCQYGCSDGECASGGFVTFLPYLLAVVVVAAIAAFLIFRRRK